MTDDLPENLRKIRVLKNFSQDYVAEKINVSVSSYARYETGKVEIDFYSVAKLADLYEMTIDDLVHFNDPEFNPNSGEPRPGYNKRAKISVVVDLDGRESTLNEWVNRLTKLNAAI